MELIISENNLKVFLDIDKKNSILKKLKKSVIKTYKKYPVMFDLFQEIIIKVELMDGMDLAYNPVNKCIYVNPFTYKKTNAWLTKWIHTELHGGLVWFEQALIHELLHKYQREIGFDEKIISQRSEHISNLIEKLKVSQHLANFREFIEMVFLLIKFEGPAYLLSKNFVVDRTFIKSQAKSKAQQLYENLSLYLKEKKEIIISELDICTGYIGMEVFTVISRFINIKDPIKLSDLKFIEYIELYERACDSMDIEPIISYSSKKGILDYSVLTNMFNEEVRFETTIESKL